MCNFVIILFKDDVVVFEKESFSVTIPRRNRGRVCVECCDVKSFFCFGNVLLET